MSGVELSRGVRSTPREYLVAARNNNENRASTPSEEVCLAQELSFPGPFPFVMDATNLYWASIGKTDQPTGAIMKMGIGGGGSTKLAGAQPRPRRLVMDDTHLYWLSQWGGVIRKMPIGGGAFSTVVKYQTAANKGAYGLAVDETCVYWTDSDNGVVMKIAK